MHTPRNTIPRPLTGAYTQPVTIHLPDSGSSLHVMIQPGTDTDDRFIAWHEDSQDFIRVNGWMVEIETHKDTTK
jgi:hypothetical protein